MKFLYWTLWCPRLTTGPVVRIAVTSVFDDRVHGVAESGARTHRPMSECWGQYPSAETARAAQEAVVRTRQTYRNRREMLSHEKQELRREERRALLEVVDHPPPPKKEAPDGQ